VNSVSPELLGQFSTGQIITGVLGFNSETEDVHPGSTESGFYPGALGFGHVTVEPGDDDPDYLAQILGGDIHLVDGISPSHDRDQYVVGADTNAAHGVHDIVGPPVNGWELEGFEINLQDLDGLAFDSDQLPLLPPDLTDFAGYPYSMVRLIFGRPGIPYVPQVTVFFWPEQPGARFFIAESGTLALLGLGLLGIGLTRRKAH
jgi:hypothetical protein